MEKLIKEGLKNTKLEREKKKKKLTVHSNRLGFRFKGKKKKRKKKRVRVRIRRMCHTRKEKGQKALPREHLLGSCYEFSSISLSCHTV